MHSNENESQSLGHWPTFGFFFMALFLTFDYISTSSSGYISLERDKSMFIFEATRDDEKKAADITFCTLQN